jgi:hypothetical protein
LSELIESLAGHGQATGGGFAALSPQDYGRNINTESTSMIRGYLFNDLKGTMVRYGPNWKKKNIKKYV